jgi:oligosaccharide repeat unit polymerase
LDPLVTDLDRFQTLPLPFWLVGLVGIYALARHIRPDWLAPVNVVTVMLVWFFFLGPLVQIASDSFDFPYTADPTYHLWRAGWLALLGLIAFLLGYRLPARGMIGDAIGRFADALASPNRFRLGLLVVGAYALGILILLHRYARGGGLAEVLELRQAIGAGPWWLTPGILLANVACVLAYCYWGHKRALFPALFTLGMLLLVFGLRAITGRRAWALEPIIAVLFAARYLEKKVRPSFLAALIVTIGLLGIVLSLGDLRTLGAYSQQAAQAGSWLPRLLHETSRLRSVIWLVQFVPQEVPFNWGVGFLGEAFPLFFGRIFAWSGITWFQTGQITTVAIGPDASGAGAASTPIGPLYHEFSVPGVVLGFVFFGWLMKVTYRKLIRERGTPSAVAIYTLFLFFAWIYTIGGSWQALYHLQLQIGFTVGLLYIVRSRRTQRSERARHSLRPRSRLISTRDGTVSQKPYP